MKVVAPTGSSLAGESIGKARKQGLDVTFGDVAENTAMGVQIYRRDTNNASIRACSSH